jgi:hypothetical protein
MTKISEIGFCLRLVGRTYSVIGSVMDELKDSVKAISSVIESIDSKHNQMQVDLNLIKNELCVVNLRSFASKVKDAFVLQPAPQHYPRQTGQPADGMRQVRGPWPKHHRPLQRNRIE